MKQKLQDLMPLEFSYPIFIADLKGNTQKFTLNPNAVECKAIAKRIDVEAIETLKCEGTAEIVDEYILYIHGKFKVKVHQLCVVSLEKIENIVEDEFEGWFADKARIASFKKAQQELEAKKNSLEIVMSDEKDDPEPLENGAADAGELFVQFLSLAIDPYAHKEGISLEQLEGVTQSAKHKTGVIETQNPFAALKNWRPKD